MLVTKVQLTGSKVNENQTAIHTSVHKSDVIL